METDTMMKLTGPRPAAAGAGVLAAILATSALAAGGATAATSARQGRPATAAAGSMLVAWGDNFDGQLGDGTLMQRVVPVQVKLKAGTVITSVRAGCRDSVALTSSGQVLDWGAGGLGQLGNGTRARSKVPVQVKLPAGTKVTSVRAGCDYNLALTAAGRVLAWGQNPVKRVLPGMVPAVSALPAPVKFPAGTKVTAISAGAQFAMALTAGHRVYAWGRNDFGDLGNGTQKSSRTPVRVHVPAGVTVTAVAAGQDFALARTSTGGMLAWGDDSDGQLGNGQKTALRKLPVRVSLPGGARVQSLFAGCFHAIATTSAGDLLAWGANDLGQLGDGTTADRSRPGPVKLPPGVTVTSIGAGCTHSLVLGNQHDVWSWGGSKDSTSVVQVMLPPGTEGIGIGTGPTADSSFAMVTPAR
jgi:alpha-tubulin suppressor-like RCC1 family protein